MRHPDDDHGIPLPEDEEFEVVSTVVRRPARAPRSGVDRRAVVDLPPALPPPRQALPAPATPHTDPIPDILPHGSIATLSGASGVGKTALVAGWIRAWQSGGLINGHQTNTPIQIGMLAVDRPWRDHARWFAKAGCDPFAYYALRDDTSFNWNRFRDWKQVPQIFAECVDRIGLAPGSLLIVDPLPLFIPGRLNEYKDVAIGLALLDHELKLRQLSMLGIFHVGKQRGDAKQNYQRPQDRILGSGGQIGYSETAMYLLSPGETGNAYYEVGWVPHQIREEAFKLQRDEEGLFVPYDEAEGMRSSADDLERAIGVFRPDRQHPAAWLVASIMQAAGVKDRRAKELLAQLCKANRVQKVKHGYYQLIQPS